MRNSNYKRWFLSFGGAVLSRGIVAYGGAKYAFRLFIALFGGFYVSWCYFAISPLHGALEKTPLPKSSMLIQTRKGGFQ